MINIQKNFQRSLRQFENKGNLLPPKILWKLDLVLYMIQGNIPNKDMLSQQQLMEFQDLQNLDLNSLKLVFNNITDTLFSKQQIQSIKCQLKKKALFSSWIRADILHDTRNFLINYSHKTYTFDKKDCEIKRCKQSKRSLELYFQNSPKYTFKFEDQSKMKSILKLWQKQIIDNKSQRNYQQMKTLIESEKTSHYMQRINLFSRIQHQQTMEIKNTSFSRQNSPFKQSDTTLKMNRSFIGNQTGGKTKCESFETVNLKPVPHGYSPKLKNERSIIALSRGDQAKIYIEYICNGKFHQKHLLSLLLMQKSWNSYIIMEAVEKSENYPSEIYITRKFDSLNELGEFSQASLNATYTSWSRKTCMINIQSVSNKNQNPLLYSKSIITLEAQDNNVRISIEDELSSPKYSSENLKKVLLEMYRQIIKIDLIQGKIVFKDFQAETLITNMLEDEQSTNTESLQDLELSTVLNYTNREASQQLSSSSMDHSCLLQINCSRRLPDSQILRLKSPLQYPNPEYICSVRNKEFERNYFKYYFPQDNLKQYDTYIPSYRLDKMIEAKIYEITSSRELKFIDQELLDNQKETLRFVLRQIGANLISGKSILNVSLPVDIFQSRTGLQRSASSFACCPDYLISIPYSSTLEQIQYVTGFIINVISCELVMQKPFNPILGETFQGYIKGIPIYYEQISHNPPISSYYMKCEHFTLYGNLIPFADVGLNTGVGGNLGPMSIIFPNGSHFQCYFPPSQIAGLIYGDRKFRCYNKGYIIEKKSKLYAEFSIQNQKKGVYETPLKLKGGQIIGGIYRVKAEFIEEIQKYRRQHKSLKKFTGLSKEYIVEKYHSISGQWFSNIMIDSRVINQGKKLYPVEYAKNLLPSDSNYRLDVLYHKMKDLTHSQKQKQILEVIQRGDRKLREKYGFNSH